MQFEVEGKASNESDKRAVVAFLASLDPARLSAEILDSYGWGTDGDPVTSLIEILKRRVEEW